jgi:hypothetical protein
MTPSSPIASLLCAFVALSMGLAASLLAQDAPTAQPLAPRNISPSATKPGVTVSANKQFVIHGADLNTRAAFSMMSEETGRSLGSLLRDDGRFVIPVVVVLKTPPDVNQADATVIPRVDQLMPSGFHFQLNVQLRPDFRTEDYTRELIRVLLAERILRNHQQLETSRQRVLPDWTLTGIMQALEFRSRSRPSAVFSAVFRSGQIYSVDRILSADPTGLDALSRTIFETSSCALVLSLLDQPEGPLRFSHFLSSLATGTQSDRELLEHYFPSLGASKNSMEKWWTLQMAALATPGAMETMSVTETEQALDNALALRFNKEEKEEDKPKEKTKEKAKEKEPEKPKSTTDEAPKKESGGLFGWLLGSKKDAPDEEKKKEEKSKPDNKPATKEKAKEAPKKKDEAASEPEEEKKPIFSLPSNGNPFGRRIFFPFSKKKTDDTEESDSAKEEAEKKSDSKKKPPAKKAAEPAKPEKPAEKKAAETSKPTKPAEKKPAESPKPAEKKAVEPDKKSRAEAAKPESPITEPNKIARKKETTRTISGRPADLPPDSPPKAIAKPDAKKEEPSADEHHSSWNPRNWFRKSPAELPKGAVMLSKLKETETKHEEPPKKTVQDGLPVEDFKQVWARKDRKDIFKQSLLQLDTLKLRAHPLYRTLIGEYASVLEQLSSGKDGGALSKLEKLRAQRLKIHEGAAAVESYMDWYEASQVQSYSGVFDDYLKLRKKLDEAVLPRSDALSKYLDAVQKEFE